MALIKCIECGEKISDKANSCIHCGCPMNFQEKTEEKVEKVEKKKTNESYYDTEIEIAKLEHDYVKIEKHKAILFPISIFLTISLVGIPLAVYTFASYLLCRCSKNNVMILTNKRITGEIKVLGQTTKIDIPLDKIESIHTDIGLFKIESVKIQSGITARGVAYALNGDKFCRITNEEIEKYKAYIYNKR